jgi:hypothetical protein
VIGRNRDLILFLGFEYVTPGLGVRRTKSLPLILILLSDDNIVACSYVKMRDKCDRLLEKIDVAILILNLNINYTAGPKNVFVLCEICDHKFEVTVITLVTHVILARFALSSPTNINIIPIFFCFTVFFELS